MAMGTGDGGRGMGMGDGDGWGMMMGRGRGMGEVLAGTFVRSDCTVLDWNDDLETRHRGGKWKGQGPSKVQRRGYDGVPTTCHHMPCQIRKMVTKHGTL